MNDQQYTEGDSYNMRKYWLNHCYVLYLGFYNVIL